MSNEIIYERIEGPEIKFKIPLEEVTKKSFKQPKKKISKAIKELEPTKEDKPKKRAKKKIGSQRKRLIEFLKELPLGEYTYDEISEKGRFNKGLLYQYYEEFKKLGFKKEIKEGKKIIVKEGEGVKKTPLLPLILEKVTEPSPPAMDKIKLLEPGILEEWGSGNYNRRCSKCHKGKPKSAFPKLGTVCLTCKEGKA